MKFIATSRDEQNAAVLDPWSVVHLAAGLATSLVGVSPGVGFGADKMHRAAADVFPGRDDPAVNVQAFERGQ